MTAGAYPVPSLRRNDCVPNGLFRHPAWLAWKASHGWEIVPPLPVAQQTGAADGVAFLSRPIGDGRRMAYASGNPYAALLDGLVLGREELGASLERLSLAATPRLGPDCAFIRWDLPFPEWTSPDRSPLAVCLQELRMNASTRERRLRKAPAEGCSLDTFVVDLTGGADAILLGMDARTRYSLRLARRRGTETVREGMDGLGEFHGLYAETMRRHGLRVHPRSSFAELFKAAAKEGLDLRLYAAYSRGQAAAGAIIARQGGDAWYLFAASSSTAREAAGPSAVLAKALVDCAKAGDRSMDLLGACPEGMEAHPLSGITRFKAGFGGVRRRRAGAWDFVLDQEAYTAFAQAESMSSVIKPDAR